MWKMYGYGNCISLHFISIGSIDGTESRSLARMVNDKGDGQTNAKMKLIQYGQPCLCLFATQAIEVGDEILYDYGLENLPWRNKVC